MQKLIVGGRPLLRKILNQTDRVGLTIGATMIGGGRPLLSEILDESDRVSLIFPLFLLVARPP